ncbi:UDP-N-acetylmuramoyl-tripeptide--D-alanyl-D-alanine ligase [Parelusimicrobium proximum]
MKLNITFKELAKIVKGVVTGDESLVIDSFSTDSRTIKKGDIFWALKGEKYDANDFLADVVKKGAKAVVCAKGRAKDIDVKKTAVLEVDDTLAALQRLAAKHRKDSGIKVACITGSNGKSTVKQMLLSICQSAGKTIATKGNLNNHIGTPMSLLEISKDDKYGVFELGASKKGDIEEIGSLARPNVAVITNISAAHLEFFKDLKTVFKTKTEIIDTLDYGGVLVYNSDDLYLRKLKTEYKGKAISFGFKRGADVHIKNTDNFEFTYKGETFAFTRQLEKYNKLNAAAACAAAIALGLYKDNLEKGIEKFEPMPMRMEVKEKGGVKFILDCYNANPASVSNAIDILSDEPKRPLIAVLGDMKELGKSSKRFHAQIAKKLVGKKIDIAFLAGPEMAAAYKTLQDKKGIIEVKYSESYKGFMTELKKALSKGGTCLIKASRSMQFENIPGEI